ncbi:MAG: hypothetical protein SXQ77_05190, partial [Halobacteria archaeon]|nr:hypothetical protein [Halobacteria archaeon]
MKKTLAGELPVFDWRTEYYVGGTRTPVDVAGVGERLILIELEWRRADPADNTAKIFRHLSETQNQKRVEFFQLFTRYYQL